MKKWGLDLPKHNIKAKRKAMKLANVRKEIADHGGQVGHSAYFDFHINLRVK